MSRIKQKFEELKQKKEGALITYLMAGDPHLQKTLDYVRALAKGGADLIELGVPFSDPVADGPTIQAAELRALKSNTTTETVFKIVKEIRKESDIPLVLMSYYNPLFRMGEDKFMKMCQDVGVDGLIVPDLPVEEADSYLSEAREYSIDTVFLATPETDEERLKTIAQSTTGFLYLVARYGTTGAREKLEDLTYGMIQKFLPLINQALPLAVGFGLSRKEHIREVIESGADGAVVGSCIVEKIGEGIKPHDLAQFTHDLKMGTT